MHCWTAVHELPTTGPCTRRPGGPCKLRVLATCRDCRHRLLHTCVSYTQHSCPAQPACVLSHCPCSRPTRRWKTPPSRSRSARGLRAFTMPSPVAALSMSTLSLPLWSSGTLASSAACWRASCAAVFSGFWLRKCSCACQHSACRAHCPTHSCVPQPFTCRPPYSKRYSCTCRKVAVQHSGSLPPHYSTTSAAVPSTPAH